MIDLIPILEVLISLLVVLVTSKIIIWITVSYTHLDVYKRQNPGINTTIKDKYFNSAASTPSVIFPLLINLAQKHLKKIRSNRDVYKRQAIFHPRKLGNCGTGRDTGIS